MGLPMFLLKNVYAFRSGDDISAYLIAAKNEKQAKQMAAEDGGNFWTSSPSCEQIGLSFKEKPEIILQGGE